MNILTVGQVLNLNSCQKGVIVEIQGIQQPETCKNVGNVMYIGGNAKFKILNLNTISCSTIPETIVRSYKISQEIYSSEQIEELLAKANDKKQQLIQEAEIAKQKFDQEVNRLKNSDMYSHLLANNSPSKNIKLHLKKIFPDVKFSVKKDGYSAVYISWEDGVTTSQVEKEVSIFEAGKFNGHEDIYEYNRTPFGQVFQTVEYIFTNRKYSDNYMEKAINYINNIYNTEYTVKEYYSNGLLHDEIARRKLIEYLNSN